MARTRASRSAGRAAVAALMAVAIAGCPNEVPPAGVDAGAAALEPPEAPTVAPDPQPDPPVPEDWMKRGTHEADGIIWAVGKIEGVRNPSLARSVAEGRARAAIARALDPDETSGVLRGVQIVDHRRSKDGTVWALARYRRPTAAASTNR